MSANPSTLPPAASSEAPGLLPADAELVHACRSGDAQAWRQLVQRFERLIYTVPRRAGLGADEAADVFQTVFLRLHEHLDRLNQPERVQAWLVTTARRETLKLLHERRRSAPLPSTADGDGEALEWEPVDPDPLPEQLLETLQLQHRARTAMAGLSAACRRLLGLLYGSDDAPAYAAIAQQLGIAVGSIGPTRARCLARLRELIEAAP